MAGTPATSRSPIAATFGLLTWHFGPERAEHCTVPRRHRTAHAVRAIDAVDSPPRRGELAVAVAILTWIKFGPRRSRQ